MLYGPLVQGESLVAARTARDGRNPATVTGFSVWEETVKCATGKMFDDVVIVY